MSAGWDDMIAIGRIARPHGLRGQVVVNPDTDFPDERFRPGNTVCVRREGRDEALTIAAVRFHQHRPIVTLDGIASIEQAERLAGLELRVPPESREALPDGLFYREQLVGCRVVTEAGFVIGEVVGVEGTVETSRLVVRGADGEVLVPLAAEICVRVDPDRRTIVIAPIEGLLDLNR
jgi:16S rRNA processing protein RimM